MTTHEAAPLVDCHVALELSRSKWAIGVHFPDSTPVDIPGLLSPVFILHPPLIV